MRLRVDPRKNHHIVIFTYQSSSGIWFSALPSWANVRVRPGAVADREDAKKQRKEDARSVVRFPAATCWPVY